MMSSRCWGYRATRTSSQPTLWRTSCPSPGMFLRSPLGESHSHSILDPGAPTPCITLRLRIVGFHFCVYARIFSSKLTYNATFPALADTSLVVLIMLLFVHHDTRTPSVLTSTSVLSTLFPSMLCSFDTFFQHALFFRHLFSSMLSEGSTFASGALLQPLRPVLHSTHLVLHSIA